MEVKSFVSILFLFGLKLILICNAERTKDYMYEQIDGATACFRRLNATHQTGCSSSRKGTTGVIHFVQNQSDLDYILQSGKAGPYVAVMPTTLLTNKVANVLSAHDVFSGLLLYKDNDSLTNYSHEEKCPNQGSGLENTCGKKWNLYGTGLLNADFPFPIFYVGNDDDVNVIKDCFNKFNNFSYDTQYHRLLCSLELSSFMFAAVDTPTCIRRSNSVTNLNPTRFCDPMGDENVWASLFPIENATNAEENPKYVIVAARLDTTTMFHEIVPGAVNPLTGIVTLLSTAHFLKKMLPHNNNYPKNVLFILFNGETYDYIGSQRLLYDMEHDAFPMKVDTNIKNPVPLVHLEDISLFIEISQLSRSDAVYIHSLEENAEIAEFTKKLSTNSFTLNITRSSGILPPASLQTFLKYNSSISGIVIADHKTEYKNKFYNSIYDNASNINYRYYNVSKENGVSAIPDNSIQRFVATVSDMLARSIYEEVTNNKYKGNEEIDVTLVDELFNCYLLDPNCKIHRAFQKKKLRNMPYNLYVGVSYALNLVTGLIGLTLAWLTGDVIGPTDSNCTNNPHNPVYQYFNMSESLDDLNSTSCFRTTMNFTEAVSPAFIIDDYDWKSGKYSSWTESIWRDFNVRLFVKPSAAHENMTIAIGSATFVFSLLIVYFVKSRSRILFAPIDISPTSC